MRSRTRWVVALCAAVSVGQARPADAQEVRFVGFTRGCFFLTSGPACDPTPAGLTYAFETLSTGGAGDDVLSWFNSRFDVTTVGGLAPIGGGPQTAPDNVDNFGSFAIDFSGAAAPPGSTSFDGISFTLAITFVSVGALPGTGLLGGPTQLFSGVLSRAVNSAGSGGVRVTFADPQRIVQSASSPDQFLLTLDSPRGVNAAVNPVSLTGFMVADVGTFGTAVPEPSTYLLVGSGLAGLAGVAYRRGRRS